MNPINQAIEYAKQNPNSEYATELRRRIESGQLNTELKNAGLDQYVQRNETEQDVYQTGQNIKEDVNKRLDNWNQIDQNGGSAVGNAIRKFGQGAGLASDVIFEALKGVGKFALPQSAEDTIGNVAGKATEGAVKAISSTQPIPGLNMTYGDAIKKVTEGYDKLKQENPKLAQDIDAVLGIASLGLDVAGLDVAGKGAKAGIQMAKEGAGEVVSGAKKAVSAVGEMVKPVQTLPETIGQITQGATTDLKNAAITLETIDTKGVKTFKQLQSRINEKIPELSRQVDAELAKDTGTYKLKDLMVKQTTQDGVEVATDYVGRAISNLSELYAKTGDDVAKANMDALLKKAKTKGLTRLEVNNLSRTYGQEFGSKAFSKLGDPLTSVNAQAYENTRSGLKEVARGGLGGDEAKALDRKLSALYDTQTLINKNVEAVNKLKQRIQQRGLLEKIGHVTSKTLDILSGGSIRGFVGGLLPRGAGYKVMNALDIEDALRRNLDIVEKALKSKTDKGLLEQLKMMETKSIDLKKKPSLIDAAKENLKNPQNSQGGFMQLYEDNGYQIQHRITDGKPASDLGNLDEIIKEHKVKNGYLTSYDITDLKKLRAIQGNPEMDVKIYRASPVNELNNGDWVTTSKTYANDIKKQNGGKVYEYTVKAKDLIYPNNLDELPSLARFSAFKYDPLYQEARKIPIVKDKSIPASVREEMVNFIDYARLGKKKINLDLEEGASRIAEDYGIDISKAKTPKQIANIFAKILDNF